MNICFLCRNILRDNGGIETYTREMAKALSGKGHTVHIIAENKGGLYREGLGGSIHVHTVTVRERPFPGYWTVDRFLPLDDLRFSRAAATKINELLNKNAIDIIESMDYFRQGFWFALRKKAPFFMRLHGWVFNRQEGRTNPFKNLTPRERFSWYMLQKCIDAADGISAVSFDFADFAKEIWNFGNKKVRIIYNAIDASPFTPDAQTTREPSVLFVARMAKIKGIITLADAIPDVLKDFPYVKFYFAGKDLYLSDKKMTSQEYILSKAPAPNVIFLGELPWQQIIPYYQRCLMCVLPSLYEPFGITALEAMASGCALVASRAGGLKEIVEHEKDGLLTPAGDAGALAGSIKRFLRENSLREKCADNARMKIGNKFNYDKIIEETIAAYGEAITRYQASRKGQTRHAQS